jgi:hypothetical protein
MDSSNLEIFQQFCLAKSNTATEVKIKIIIY